MNEIPLPYLIVGIIVIIAATFIFITGIIFDIKTLKDIKKWWCK